MRLKKHQLIYLGKKYRVKFVNIDGKTGRKHQTVRVIKKYPHFYLCNCDYYTTTITLRDLYCGDVMIEKRY